MRSFMMGVAILIGFVLSPVTGYSQTKAILDRPVAVFETGLGMVDYDISRPYWLDADHVLITVLKDGASPEVKRPLSPMRIALIDFSKRTVKFVIDDAQVFSRDQDKGTFFVGIREVDESLPLVKQEYFYKNLRELNIQPDGKVTNVRYLSPGEKPFPEDGIPRNVKIGPGGSRGLAKRSDGYLFNDLAPGDTYARQFDRLRTLDEGRPTTWIRPGQAPLPLPLRFDELGTEIIYVDFRDQFLLNNNDTSGTSDTNSLLRGEIGQSWKRPYEYTPFRLLGRDGHIEEIPYPQFVFDYGISYRGRKEGLHFSSFLITRPGIVISKSWPSGEAALFLFESEQLYRLTGRMLGLVPTALLLNGLDMSPLVLSPDGCKIAYGHYSRSGALAYKLYTPSKLPSYIAIINLCTKKE